MNERAQKKSAEYGLDRDRTVYVVDSPTTAFMVSILADGCPIRVVLERKLDLETDNASELLMNFVKSCIPTRELKIVELPHRFYIGGKELKKIWKIRKETKQIYRDYDEHTVFVGASTSTFMRCLQCRPEQIIYLHHGLTDLIRKEDEAENKKSLKHKLKTFVIGKIIGLPYSTWCDYWPEKAFSLCKLNNDDEKWLNLYDFNSAEIERAFASFERFKDGKINVLFFPVIEGHVRDGVNPDVTSFDKLNYDFLIRHIDPKTDRVFIKYHPWLYRANNNMRSGLIQLLQANGIEAYDIAAMIPKEIGGVLLPTEAICRYVDFDKLVSRETSTMWYLSDNRKIQKIIDLCLADDDFKKRMLHCVEILKTKSDTDDIQFFI